MRRRTGRILVTAIVAVGAVTAIAYAGPKNGGFESGHLKPWKVKDPGGGDWYVYKGRTIVEDPGPPLPRGLEPQFYRPPRGKYAAAAYQDGPGLNILHRVLRLKNDATNKLSFFLAWRNSRNRFWTPNSFEFGEGGGVPIRGPAPPPADPNQQFRIDLLKRRAPVDTLKKKHIVATLFKVKRGTRDSRRYKRQRYNLTKMGVEGKVRFRVAEVDNQGVLPVGIDQVKLKSKPRD